MDSTQKVMNDCDHHSAAGRGKKFLRSCNVHSVHAYGACTDRRKDRFGKSEIDPFKPSMLDTVSWHCFFLFFEKMALISGDPSIYRIHFAVQ